MGLTKVVACFAVVLLVGSEVSAYCLDDCYINCIGYDWSTCVLGCYVKCKWKQGKEIEALVAKPSPFMKAKLHEIEDKAEKEVGSRTPRKLQTATKF